MILILALLLVTVPESTWIVVSVAVGWLVLPVLERVLSGEPRP